jgi:hypothetical protein
MDQIDVGTATLTVDLAGEVRALAPGEVLTFGRAADLVVDEANRYLHRVLGRFSWHGGWWWVENLGSQVDLEVVGDDGALARLPGSRCTPSSGRSAGQAFRPRRGRPIGSPGWARRASWRQPRR